MDVADRIERETLCRTLWHTSGEAGVTRQDFPRFVGNDSLKKLPSKEK